MKFSSSFALVALTNLAAAAPAGQRNNGAAAPSAGLAAPSGRAGSSGGFAAPSGFGQSFGGAAAPSGGFASPSGFAQGGQGFASPSGSPGQGGQGGQGFAAPSGSASNAAPTFKAKLARRSDGFASPSGFGGQEGQGFASPSGFAGQGGQGFAAPSGSASGAFPTLNAKIADNGAASGYAGPSGGYAAPSGSSQSFGGAAPSGGFASPSGSSGQGGQGFAAASGSAASDAFPTLNAKVAVESGVFATGSSGTGTAASAASTGSSSTNSSSSATTTDGPIGYASTNGGTTGGEGGTTTTVSSLAEFTAAATADEATVVYISGTISGSTQVKVTSDTSIIGLNSESALEGIGLYVKDVSNVILRNFASSKVLADNGDAIGIQASTNVWCDHLDLSSDLEHGKDYYDGLLDVTHASEWVTISNVYFHDHYKASLVGHSDSNGDEDTGHLHVTYANNYWSNISSRAPSIRFGTGHIFNSYFEGLLSSGIDTRDGAQVLVESNVFSDSEKPLASLYSDDEGYAVSKDNDFGSGSDTASEGTLDSVPYEYTLLGSSSVKAAVVGTAGNTLTFA